MKQKLFKPKVGGFMDNSDQLQIDDDLIGDVEVPQRLKAPSVIQEEPQEDEQVQQIDQDQSHEQRQPIHFYTNQQQNESEDYGYESIEHIEEA